MKYIKPRHIKMLSAIIIAGGIFSLSSCKDDFDMSYSDPQHTEPWNNPDMAVIPIGISFERGGNTRADEPESLPRDTVYGNSDEHEIDFDTEHECYAIFFVENEEGEKTVKYIQPLYYNKQLSDKIEQQPDDLAEYTVYAVAYVPKTDVNTKIIKDENAEGDGDTETPGTGSGNTNSGNEGNGEDNTGGSSDEEEEDSNSPKLSHVLVVLNGGKMYKKLHELIYSKDNQGHEHVRQNITDKQVLEVTWDYPMEEDQGHYHEPDPLINQGPIGINAKGLFTMTNSAYYSNKKDEVDDEETGGNTTRSYELKTLAKVNSFCHVSIEDFLKDPESKPNAVVQVERMVSKFSAPILATEVYGSDRFFRPSDNVPHLTMQSWDENGEEVKTQVDWRIHLLGWTVNGGESSSYLFKKIKNIKNTDAGYTNWGFLSWNDQDLSRSYWSEDPHYDLSKYSNGKTDFYPWQYRLAADLTDVVSWEAGIATGEKPALRYSKFSDIKWEPVLYMAENTFDPAEEGWDLDSRTELLAGPHLLITGELYLKGEPSDNSYLPTFGKVAHLYSDRNQRFYKSEIDFFKMFLTEFQSAVTTQWSMEFNLLDWDDPSVKVTSKFKADVAGDYQIFYRCPKDQFTKLEHRNPQTATEDLENKLYNRIKSESNYYIDLEDQDYIYQELTFSVIDAIQYQNEMKDTGLFSYEAKVYQGDGRIIPWLENLHVRKPDPTYTHTDKHRQPLLGLNFIHAGGQTREEIEAKTRTFDFRTNCLRSFIREWWGTVDHFNGGRMYYSGAIKHHDPKDPNYKTYYGTVRNHWYKFTINSINGIGTPISNPNQMIIPDKYSYKDQIGSDTEISGFHLRDTQIDFGN